MVTPNPVANSVSFLSYSIWLNSMGRHAITLSSLDMSTVRVRTKCDMRVRNLVGTSPLTACSILTKFYRSCSLVFVSIVFMLHLPVRESLVLLGVMVHNLKYGEVS